MIRNLTELYQYRALLFALTARELKARYRASVLGFLWTFLNPTLTMVVYVIVFQVLIRQQVENYAYFLFVGLLPWICFSSSVLGGATSISDRRDLLTKVRFPAQVLPATVVATHVANFLLSLPLLAGLGLLYDVWPTWHVVLFPVILAAQIIFTLALTYLLSAFNVAYRDLQHLTANVMQMMLFLTPIMYSIEQLTPETKAWVLYLNPMAALISAYRDIFYFHRVPDAAPLAAVAFVGLVLLWLASTVFEQRREEFAELV